MKPGSEISCPQIQLMTIWILLVLCFEQVKFWVEIVESAQGVEISFVHPLENFQNNHPVVFGIQRARHWIGLRAHMTLQHMVVVMGWRQGRRGFWLWEFGVWMGV